MSPARVTAASAVLLLSAAVAAGTLLAPAGMRYWLAVFSFVAVAVAIQAAASEPRDLLAALGLSVPAVVALTAGGGPSWLIGPLAVVLLAYAELNTLSWELRGAPPPGGDFLAGRLRDLGLLVLVGLAATFLVTFAGRFAGPGGVAGVVLAALGVAGMAAAIFSLSD